MKATILWWIPLCFLAFLSIYMIADAYYLPPPPPGLTSIEGARKTTLYLPPDRDILRIQGGEMPLGQIYYIDPNGKEWLLKKVDPNEPPVSLPDEVFSEHSVPEFVPESTTTWIDPNECQHDSTACLHDGLDANGKMVGVHVKCLDCDKRLLTLIINR